MQSSRGAGFRQQPNFRLLPAPQLTGRDSSAFNQGFKLSPHDFGMNARLPASKRSESAVRCCDDILATHQFSAAHNTLRDQFWMLHEAGHSIDHSRYENLTLRKLDLLPHAPFVPVAWIRPFQGVSLRLHLQYEIYHVLERNVVLVRTFKIAPTNMKADSILGHV